MAAGYSKNKVTTFLWEDVTLYLSEKEVSKTLSEIKQNAPWMAVSEILV